MKVVTKIVATSASLQIYNVQTKGTQHNSSLHKLEMAAPPGQFMALQAINAFKETISGGSVWVRICSSQ